MPDNKPVFDKIDSIQLKYIFDNPESYATAYYLQSKSSGNEKMTLDSIHHGLNIFNPGDIKEQDVYSNYFYNSIPAQILLDLDGKVIGHWVGSSSDNKESLERIIAEKLSANF